MGFGCQTRSTIKHKAKKRIFRPHCPALVVLPAALDREGGTYGWFDLIVIWLEPVWPDQRHCRFEDPSEHSNLGPSHLMLSPEDVGVCAYRGFLPNPDS